MANSLNVKEFHFTTVGVDTNTTWSGKFSVKLSLSPRDVLNLDRLYREFIGNTNGAEPSSIAIYYAHMLSQLAVRLVDKPDWWKDSMNGQDLKDPNILEEVWAQVSPMIEEYQASITKRAEAAKPSIRATVEKEEKETGLTG